MGSGFRGRGIGCGAVGGWMEEQGMEYGVDAYIPDVGADFLGELQVYKVLFVYKILVFSKVHTWQQS